MRCRKHPSESPVGVCASCLRESLINLLAREEQKRFEFTQPLHISSPRVPISEELEADNLNARFGTLLAGSERQSKSAVREGNSNPEGNPNRLKLSLVRASCFWKSPDVAKSRRTDKSHVHNHEQNKGFKENEVAGSSPWRRQIENTIDEELPHKPGSRIYSWLLRRKSKANHVEFPDQANSVADKSFITAVSSFDDNSNRNSSEGLDLFNSHHDALRAQLSPVQHNLRVFSPNHCVKQESKYFSNSSFLSKRRTKILNIFRKNSAERSTPQRYKERENSKVDYCLQNGLIHHRNGLLHQHAKGASPASVIMESEDDQRTSPHNPRGVTCNVNFEGSFCSPKAKAGKTEGIQYNDCAGSFSPYVERRSMQSPKRFPVVSNELSSGLRFCLSPLMKPGRKLHPQANL